MTDPAKLAAWEEMLRLARSAGFTVSFNAHGVAVIVRDPDPPPTPPAP